MYGSVEEVFFSKVSGKIILEIFEKSIDKHKIDAILIRRPDSSGSLFWVLPRADESRRIPKKNPANHPDTRIPMKAVGTCACSCMRQGSACGHYSLLSRGVL